MPISYDETRLWTYWLRVFTPSDLAETMGVPVEAIQGFIIGLERNGTIEDTGDWVNGSGPREKIYSFVPLPEGPNHHPYRLPEWLQAPGIGELAPRRGEQVRIRSESDMRRILSTAGAANKHRQREKRYQKMVAIQEERRKKQEERQKREGYRPKAGKNRGKNRRSQPTAE